tara:strand:- start:463 stop:1980 length:1518 start_codon:yes stop_codon:yes gene_type:complete
MALTIDVNYFNSFYLKRVYGTGPLGNIPYVEGQGPVHGINPDSAWETAIDYESNFSGNVERDWVIEEARIRAGYNNTSVDFGVKAYIVEDNPNQQRLTNTLIYSGIFNSRTGINNTNEFSVGEEITRGVDPVGGTIQRLYAEDTNLIVFQQRKVNVALIDKDAIYTAEGLGISTSGNQVIGQITPIPGNWGIGENPESFAVYGYTKYFVDKEQNAVLKMEGTNIQDIASAGMMDFFRDRFADLGTKGSIVGGYDIYNKNYVVSISSDGRFESKSTEPSDNILTGEARAWTLAWDDRVAGWTTFFNYIPTNMFSCIGRFYSTAGGGVWQHYTNSLRNSYYNEPSDTSYVKFVFNPEPNLVKTFKTINYEGSNGWDVVQLVSDQTGEIEFPSASGLYQTYDDETTGDVRLEDGTSSGIDYRAIYSYDEGLYTDGGIEYRAGFDRKQNKYWAVIPNNTVTPIPGEVIWGNQTVGIKGYYTTVVMGTDKTTNLGGLKSLFATSSEFIIK